MHSAPGFSGSQPITVSILFAKRRSARELRGEKRADAIERMKHLKIEPFFSDSDRKAFSSKISEFENQPLLEAYARDKERSEMVFNTSMLRVAKHARQGKKRRNIRRKAAGGNGEATYT